MRKPRREDSHGVQRPSLVLTSHADLSSSLPEWPSHGKRPQGQALCFGLLAQLCWVWARVTYMGAESKSFVSYHFLFAISELFYDLPIPQKTYLEIIQWPVTSPSFSLRIPLINLLFGNQKKWQAKRIQNTLFFPNPSDFSPSSFCHSC